MTYMTSIQGDDDDATVTVEQVAIPVQAPIPTQVEASLLRLSSFSDGPPYWTGETVEALRLLLDKGLLVRVGKGDNE